MRRVAVSVIGRRLESWWRLVWEEDDCCYYPGKETLSCAWQRIYGKALNYAKACEVQDFGDCAYYFFADGRVAVSACDVSQIWMPKGGVTLEYG